MATTIATTVKDYRSANPYLFTHDEAKKIGPMLDNLRVMRGDLTPDIIVKVASQPTHALNGYFEWNDTVAAHKYRLEQARDMLRAIVISETTVNAQSVPVERQTRAFQAIPKKALAVDEIHAHTEGPRTTSTSAPWERTYVDVESIRNNSQFRLQALRQRHREWIHLIKRLGEFEEFEPYCKKLSVLADEFAQDYLG